MNFARSLLLLPWLLLPLFLRGAEAVFGPDGRRIWTVTEGNLGYFDVGDRESSMASDRQIDLGAEGTYPKPIQAIGLSKAGNLLLAAPDAVWALNPATHHLVRVAAMPAGFDIGDLAYQETTGAILVSGWFTRPDHTVERTAAFRIEKGADQAEPVFVGGLESIRELAFDAAGHLFLSTGFDLWAGDLIQTEHEQSGDFSWQIRGFRLLALGTLAAGEGAAEGAAIASLAVGGGKLIVTMSGKEGGTLLRLPVPVLPRYEGGMIDRQLSLKARWSLQQKILGTVEFLTPPEFLPRLPLVVASKDGSQIVYQTATSGLRRWWLLGKTGKARMIKEESD